MPPLAPDLEIARRYRLVARAPDGPFGERWRAVDAEGGEVHVTVFDPPRPGVTPEARAAAVAAVRGFSHAHASPARDAGLYGEAPFVVSAVPATPTLRAWVGDLRGRHTAVPLRDARSLADQVAQCLVAAHRGVSGVALAHGASLAESAFVERRGEVQLVATLADVGCLALAASTSATLPPGARADGPSPPDDVYGLGMLLAELLTGEVPGACLDLDAACARFAAARPDADPSLWQLVRDCIASSPAARPANLSRVRDLLRQAVWTPREVRAAPEAREVPRGLPPPPPEPAAPARARIVAVQLGAPAPAAPAVERLAAPPVVRNTPAPAVDAWSGDDTAPGVPDVPEALSPRSFLAPNDGATEVAITLPPPREQTSLAIELPGASVPTAGGATLTPRRMAGAVARARASTVAVDEMGFNDALATTRPPRPATLPPSSKAFAPVAPPAYEANVAPPAAHAWPPNVAVTAGAAPPPEAAYPPRASALPSIPPPRMSVLPSIPPPRPSQPMTPRPAPQGPLVPRAPASGLGWWIIAAVATVLVVLLVGLASSR